MRRFLSAIFASLFILSLAVASAQASLCATMEGMATKADASMEHTPCHEMQKKTQDNNSFDCCESSCNFCYVAQTAVLSIDTNTLKMPQFSLGKLFLAQDFKTLNHQPPHDPPQTLS